MPDLFAHFAAGYVISRPKQFHQYATFIVLGAILPDVLTRIPEIIFSRFLGVSVSFFFAIFHASACLVLTSYFLSLFFEEKERLPAFICISIGSNLHVVLDLMQSQFGDGAYIPLFPFSFKTIQWGLFHFNASIIHFPIIFSVVIIIWLVTRKTQNR